MAGSATGEPRGTPSPGLRDQVAVVSGASSGIGRAIAVALAQGGVRLCVVGRRTAALEELASTLRECTEALVHTANLSCEPDIGSLAARVRREFGRTDILVHAAGVIALGSLATATSEEFEAQYRTNLLAPFLLTQAFLPLLRERQGQVVFINSTAGLRATAGTAQYAATKHGLKALADSLREEVNPDGVRVLTVFLGRTATPMQATVHAAEDRPYRPDRLIQPEDVADIVAHALTVPRTVEVTDISLRPMLKPAP